jgi:hypothetical protein
VGLDWLGRPDAERLRALLDAARRTLRRERRPGGWRPDAFDFWPRRLGYVGDDEHATLVEPLTRAFLAVPEGVFVTTDGFLNYHAREANPLPEVLAGARRSYWYTPPDERQLERGWLDLLRYFLMERLVAFGGARLGHAGAGGFCFALTSAGSYLLGAAEDFEFSAPAAAPDGQVVVQPNFEIVFLGPSPAAEAVAGRYAQRIAAGGERVGTLYRLTRDAVFAAASTGATAEQALAALAGLSSRPLPANVERQLGDWFGACRTVRAARTLLLRCPDAETAARVRAALGRDAELLGDRAVAAPGDRLSGAVRTKLRKAGIFVEEPPAPEEKRRRDEIRNLGDFDDLDFDDDLDENVPY